MLKIKSIPAYSASMVNMTNYFDNIIFGNFDAQPGTQRIIGTLAVQGNFTANGYIINGINSNLTCINVSSIYDYALYVQGVMNTKNVTVHGGIFSSQSNNEGMQWADSNCSSTDQNLTLFDFEQVEIEAFGVSEYLASLQPNMVLRDGGFLSDGQFKGNQNQDYYIFTFESCKEQNCTLPKYLYSSPEEIFFGGNWTGPYNKDYKTDKTLVFNIPVLTDTVFNMSTANPAAGLEKAKVVYNIYPVDRSGAFDANGRFVFLRNTTKSLSGHFLAPAGFIVENSSGGFYGQLIASRYLSVVNINAMFSNTDVPLINATTYF
ncbi:hypothetical protein K501DRAFT_276017 [Backusella circina FSU 941]|nr:hypothetical protein K501DRAFT_276017 [Backusella circina FSU 941]